MVEKSITVQAKSLNDAIEQAQVQLGVVKSKLGYEVIDKGSSGIFGFGSKEATIRAWIIEDDSEVEQHLESDKIQAIKEHSQENKEDETVKETHGAGEFDNQQENSSEQKMDANKAENDAISFLQTVFEDLDMKVSFNTKANEADNTLEIELVGDDMGIVIGKRGQTLDALQYLTSLVVNKNQEAYVHIKLDTEDYRSRRCATLENLARNVAKKVKRYRKPQSLEPMTPYERRIIHTALMDDSSVSTHSEGEEPFRKVVISLKRNNKPPYKKHYR